MSIELVSGADAAAITWLSPTGMPLTCTSGVCAAELEQQQQAGAGPCIHALDQGVVAEGRISRPGESSRMVLVIPLRPSARLDGALSLYTGVFGAFDDQSIETAICFADQAARTLEVAQAMALSHSVVDFHEVMEARAVIDMAKGVLIAWRRYGPDDAFDELRTVSQHTNIKVRELAHELTESVSDPHAKPHAYFLPGKW